MNQQEKRAKARELYVPGIVTLESVAKIIGVSRSTVLRYVNDASNENTLRKSREAKRKRTGVCSQCGGETRYSGHKSNDYVSTVCNSCAHSFTHCSRGHLYTPETDLRGQPGYKNGGGHSCRICRNAHMREWAAAKRRAEGRPERDPAAYESRRLNWESEGAAPK